MKTAHKAAGAGGAAVIACCIAFTPIWEGMDSVAKVDTIGTGHPVTYCYGQTDEFGKVKVGTRFTKKECDAKLAESLPKYLEPLQGCVHVPLPDKTMASLLDAAYNAGPAAVCKSQMVALMNAGHLNAGCRAFDGWYVRSDGVVRKGLVNRRSGDTRKGEKQLCLEGITEVISAPPAPTPVPAPKAVSIWDYILSIFKGK
jgi:lysozyme